METAVFYLMAEEGSTGAKVGGHQASWASPFEMAAAGPLGSWDGESGSP